MNSTSSIDLTIFINNLTRTTIESWFIPFDILMIVCTVTVIIFATLFLIIIASDKTCHTTPMMLTANTCLSALVLGCSMLSLCIFMLQNDLKQISYQDSLCIIRAYIDYVSCALIIYSFLLQALYRYLSAVYPTRLFYQSMKFQFSLICLTWIFCFVYPLAFMFTDEIKYNVDNQICQLVLRLCFSIIYGAQCIYVIPVLIINFIYLKLIRYVHVMNKRTTPVNVLSRVKRQLRMVRRTIILLMIIIVMGCPYGIFIFISFFTSPPKYHFRIAFIFIDLSLVVEMLVLFQFTDPLQTSIMKRIRPRPNVVVARVT
jgi:hypothetical protein